jgi:hypothetical protein
MVIKVLSNQPNNSVKELRYRMVSPGMVTSLLVLVPCHSESLVELNISLANHNTTSINCKLPNVKKLHLSGVAPHFCSDAIANCPATEDLNLFIVGSTTNSICEWNSKGTQHIAALKNLKKVVVQSSISMFFTFNYKSVEPITKNFVELGFGYRTGTYLCLEPFVKRAPQMITGVSVDGMDHRVLTDFSKMTNLKKFHVSNLVTWPSFPFTTVSTLQDLRISTVHIPSHDGDRSYELLKGWTEHHPSLSRLHCPLLLKHDVVSSVLVRFFHLTHLEIWIAAHSLPCLMSLKTLKVTCLHRDKSDYHALAVSIRDLANLEHLHVQFFGDETRHDRDYKNYNSANGPLESSEMRLGYLCKFLSTFVESPPKQSFPKLSSVYFETKYFKESRTVIPMFSKKVYSSLFEQSFLTSVVAFNLATKRNMKVCTDCEFL